MFTRYFRFVAAIIVMTCMLPLPDAMASSYGEMKIGAQTKATYTACNPQYVVPATPSDMVVIGGSGTKTIKILKIRLLTEQTTAGTNFIYVIKRSTADTAGTANAVTPMKHDSNDAAATASVNYYTANPTVGTIDSYFLNQWDVQSPAAASTIQPNWLDIFDAHVEGEPIVLRGTAQQLAVNLGGVTLPSGFKVQVQITWTEE